MSCLTTSCSLAFSTANLAWGGGVRREGEGSGEKGRGQERRGGVRREREGSGEKGRGKKRKGGVRRRGLVKSRGGARGLTLSQCFPVLPLQVALKYCCFLTDTPWIQAHVHTVVCRLPTHLPVVIGAYLRVVLEVNHRLTNEVC